jgi:hypothetical protein
MAVVAAGRQVRVRLRVLAVLVEVALGRSARVMPLQVLPILVVAVVVRVMESRVLAAPASSSSATRRDNQRI